MCTYNRSMGMAHTLLFKILIKGKASGNYGTTDVFPLSVMVTDCIDFVHSSRCEGTLKIIGNGDSGGIQKHITGRHADEAN